MNAQMFNHIFWIKYVETEKLKELVHMILDKSGFNILNVCEHYFSPQGYTGLWLLSESHLAVHTFPEESKIYVELSSCVEEPFYRFIDYVKNSSEVEVLRKTR